jgi:hypothetical protein
MFCPLAAAGRVSVVVIYAPEPPVQAARPASGLPKAVEMVPL